MTFRFVHSGDLHLGKRFGQFSGDLPAKLREARHATIGRLAEHARVQGASTILLAGDTFDTETPAFEALPAPRRGEGLDLEGTITYPPSTPRRDLDNSILR